MKIALDSQRNAARRTIGRSGQLFPAKGGSEIQARFVDANQTAELRSHGTNSKRCTRNSCVMSVGTALIAGGQGRRSLRSARLLAVASRGMKMKRRKRKRISLRRGKSQ